MRIVSKFHDYYDGPATMFGQEPLFIRDTNMPPTMWPKVQQAIINSAELRNGKYYSKYHAIIVFCGETYILEYMYENTRYGMPGKKDTVERVKGTDWHKAVVKNTLDRHPELATCPIWTPNWHYYPGHRESPDHITNPILKDYDFAKIVDPYTAAQELDRFLTNLAQPIEVPKPVDDLTKIKSHGFDVNRSFRKDKDG